MKIRMGFVSNSSSSSFVLVVELNWFRECLKEASEYSQHVVKAAGIDLMNVLGIPCVIMEGWATSEETHLTEIEKHPSELKYWDHENNEWFVDSDITQRRDQAFEEFEVLVSRKKDKIFLHTMDT